MGWTATNPRTAAARAAKLAPALLVVLFAGCASLPFAERHSPTDTRAIYPSAGEEAIRRSPVGVNRPYGGYQPTCWTPLPSGWHCPAPPCACEAPVELGTPGPAELVAPEPVELVPPKPEPAASPIEEESLMEPPEDPPAPTPAPVEIDDPLDLTFPDSAALPSPATATMAFASDTEPEPEVVAAARVVIEVPAPPAPKVETPVVLRNPADPESMLATPRPRPSKPIFDRSLRLTSSGADGRVVRFAR